MSRSPKWLTVALVFAALALPAAAASEGQRAVSDDVIAAQRAALAASTSGAGFGPQAPRDIGIASGSNARNFGATPAVTEMALCDIHFHESAEHKGGEFTIYGGNGDGKGYGTGYRYDGKLTDAELAPTDVKIGATDHGDLVPGDTIEIHFVHSTAQATLGKGLGTCLSDAIVNPQLRVETVVGVLVNEPKAADFTEMAKIVMIGGRNQVPNLPNDLGKPVIYAGSTTGPSYNEKGSPFQVTWSVRPKVVKINITSVGRWLADNPFDERYAHGVRNLVVNPDLLSPISMSTAE